MPSFKITRTAQADLIAIGRFTLKEWGAAQRNIYLKQLDHCFAQLSTNPELGTACADRLLALGIFPCDSV